MNAQPSVNSQLFFTFIIYIRMKGASGDSMNKHAMISTMAFVVMIVLLVSIAPKVHAQTTTGGEDDNGDNQTTTQEQETINHEPTQTRDSDGTVWMQTNVMTVMLNPTAPSYQYWYTPDKNGSLARFKVSYLMVVEFQDLNGDGVYQPNETLQFAPLQAFDWTLQTGSVKDSTGHNTEIYASYVKGGLSSGEWDNEWFKHWMPGYGEEGTSLSDENRTEDQLPDNGTLNLAAFEPMTMRFYAHLYLNNYNGTVSDDKGIKANYTVDGGVELKIDIEIGNFPFMSNTSKVAVLNYLQEDVGTNAENHAFGLEEDGGTHQVDTPDTWQSGSNLGQKFENDDGNHSEYEDNTQQLSFIEASTNITRGFYRWLDKAVQTLPDGSKTAVDVQASYWADSNALLLFLAYPNFDNGSILHDPSVRFSESASPVPIPTQGPLDIPSELAAGILIGAIALVLIGVAIKRRR